MSLNLMLYSLIFRFWTQSAANPPSLSIQSYIFILLSIVHPYQNPGKIIYLSYVSPTLNVPPFFHKGVDHFASLWERDYYEGVYIMIMKITFPRLGFCCSKCLLHNMYQTTLIHYTAIFRAGLSK